MNDGLARFVLVSAGVFFLLIGIGIQGDKAAETFLPNWWLIIFGVAAVTTWLFAGALSRWALFLSGLTVPIVFALRVCATIDRVNAKTVAFSRLWVSIGTYGAYGALVLFTSIIWIRVFAPLVSWRSQRR